MSKLLVLEGPDAGAKFEFTDGRILIGRGGECQIRLNQASISRQHAALTFQGGDGWLLEDLNSQNGVFVNGTQISRQLLSATTPVRLGTVNMSFEAGPEITAKQRHLEHDNSATDTSIEDVKAMKGITASIISEFGRVIIGQKEVAEQLLIAIAAGGHCLMIGLPGLAKTLMVSTLAQILKLQFKRVQFTPDLMPSDIIGTDVLDVDEQTGRKSFRFIKGPIFTNIDRKSVV